MIHLHQTNVDVFAPDPMGIDFRSCHLNGSKPGEAELGIGPEWNSSKVDINVNLRNAQCEDRIGTGPPRARAEVIYVDLGYLDVDAGMQVLGIGSKWIRSEVDINVNLLELTSTSTYETLNIPSASYDERFGRVWRGSNCFTFEGFR